MIGGSSLRLKRALIDVCVFVCGGWGAFDSCAHPTSTQSTRSLHTIQQHIGSPLRLRYHRHRYRHCRHHHHLHPHHHHHHHHYRRRRHHPFLKRLRSRPRPRCCLAGRLAPLSYRAINCPRALVHMWIFPMSSSLVMTMMTLKHQPTKF
jgi:hypothetical protein